MIIYYQQKNNVRTCQATWRYVTFVPAVPGVPTSDTTISGTKKNDVQKKLNYEKLSEKVGTGGTLGTDSKRECGSQNNDLFDSHNWRFVDVSSWKDFEGLDNKGCLNAFYGLPCKHGKSPCFLALSFLMLLRVDCQTLILLDVNGEEILD